MVEGGTIAIIVVVVVVVLVVYSIKISIQVVREKQNIIIERFGEFKAVLTPGVHFIIPFVDRPKTYSWNFLLSQNGVTQRVTKRGMTRVPTKNEVMDFPKQAVITRDNAMIHLDAVLNYKIINAKDMIYNSQNLPHMLSKLLQAQIRNVAGMLDVDQIIEDNSAMDRVSQQMAAVAGRWGVHIEFVRIQKVEAGALTSVLAKKKNADLKNKEVIISAKAQKQTRVIESEGHRDRMIKEAEGEAQQILSRARGEAQAITNAANAEREAVVQIARAIARTGENPTKFLLALKYIEAMKRIAGCPNTTIKFLPKETAMLQTVQGMGLNTVLPPARQM